MTMHLDEDNLVPRPENLTLRSAGIPITTIKGLAITIVAALIAIGTYHMLDFDSESVKLGLALLVFIGIMWLTEAVHITITALMVPFLAVLFRIPTVKAVKQEDGSAIYEIVTKLNPKTGNEDTVFITFKSALASFADPTIFTFFGGFAIAAALHMQRLDRKIAGFMVSLAGGDMMIATFLIFLVTAGLSMWISNTATAAMMLPLAIGMLDTMDREKDRRTFVFVLLGIAYCASIGGLGTIVGSPPNNIAARDLGYAFKDWMRIGLPVMCLLLPITVATLWLILRPNFNFRRNTTKTEAEAHDDYSLKEEIPWTYHRIVTVVIFATTALLWIFSSQINGGFELGGHKFAGLKIDAIDSVIALMAAIAVVLFGACSWKEVAQNTDWGVLLMFGGGLALSAVLSQSGASDALGRGVAAALKNSSPIVIIFAVATFIIFLTEFTSNTASAALLVPVFGAIAVNMGMPKETVVLVIGIGASCAFMMPVATPPNAIVFGTGLIKQREMMTVGLALNFVSILIVAGFICLTQLGK